MRILSAGSSALGRTSSLEEVEDEEDGEGVVEGVEKLRVEA